MFVQNFYMLCESIHNAVDSFNVSLVIFKHATLAFANQ